MSRLDKPKLRDAVRGRISVLTEAERAEMALSAARRVLALREFLDAKTVMLYRAYGREIDPEAIARFALENDKTVCYPAVISENEMIALSPKGETAWRRGAFGILEPDPDSSRVIRAKELDIVIAPGVAFDEVAQRLGRGKGYYDRFLAHACAYRIGFAYECQIVDRIDACVHDVRMNAVASDSRLIIA